MVVPTVVLGWGMYQELELLVMNPVGAGTVRRWVLVEYQGRQLMVQVARVARVLGVVLE